MKVALEETQQAPDEPGVYRFWNRSHQVVYVGKAKNLKKRLSQYRTGREAASRVNISLLLKGHVSIDWVVTTSEKEALILEDTLIKEHRPRYNIRMRDDKSYVHLRLTTEHEFPRLVRVRRPSGNEENLFGPYPSSFQVKILQQTVHKVLPLRTCTDSKFNNRVRPCLEHQIGRCSAPCVGKISAENYQQTTDDVRRFLRGDDRSLVKEWQQRMLDASEVMDFERAAHYRDLSAAAKQVWEKQSVDVRSVDTMDAIASAVEGSKIAFTVSSISDGVVRENRVIGPLAWQGDEGEVMEQFLLQYYRESFVIPAKIAVNIHLPSLEAIGQVLSDRRGKSVDLVVPERGIMLQRVKMSHRQALHALSGESPGIVQLAAVEKLLKIASGSVHRVECFDISEVQGTHAVGGDVVFLYGEPAPELYRRYKIKLNIGENDFAKMHEMLGRRARRAIEDRDMPDMIVIDGGKGQLNAALRAFKDLEVEPPLLIGLAKARANAEEGSERGFERLFLPGRSNPILLKPGTPAFKFFVRIRDETHKLAVGYHRKFRRADALKGMERIKGLGSKRRKALLDTYVNLEQLRYETAQDIAQKATLPLGVAENIVAYMQGSDQS